MLKISPSRNSKFKARIFLYLKEWWCHDLALSTCTVFSPFSEIPFDDDDFKSREEKVRRVMMHSRVNFIRLFPERKLEKPTILFEVHHPETRRRYSTCNCVKVDALEGKHLEPKRDMKTTNNRFPSRDLMIKTQRKLGLVYLYRGGLD